MIIFKIYAKICWILGMRDRDEIEYTTDDREFFTYILRRQRARWGDPAWYTVVIVSILASIRYEMFLESINNYWFIFFLILIPVQIWLGLHVIESTYTGRKS
jgi:hypothetical protein